MLLAVSCVHLTRSYQKPKGTVEWCFVPSVSVVQLVSLGDYSAATVAFRSMTIVKQFYVT